MATKQVLYGTEAQLKFQESIAADLRRVRVSLKQKLMPSEARQVDEIVRQCQEQIASFVQKATTRVDSLVV